MKRGSLFIFILCLCGLCGCNQRTTDLIEETNGSQTLVVTFAGDCTLGTDEAFGGITLPKELELQNNDYGYFFRNVRPYFETDHLTVVNLEGTLTDRGTRAEKTYAFRGDPAYTRILTEGSVEAVTLANNHTLDYGEESLADTKAHLDAAGIHWVEGLHTKTVTAAGVPVGLVGLNGLSSAARKQLPVAMEQVKQDGAQLILVQFHWGIEKEATPTALQRELAHQAIDLGADLVVGHHPHVLQGLEEYQGKMIVYSLGNFCFGGNQNPTDKDTMLYRQTFTLEEGIVTDAKDYQVIPCLISSLAERNNYQPTPAFGKEAERIAARIQRLSNLLGEQRVEFAGGIGEKLP